MSEALNQALESVGRALEEAVVDAERELIHARARCHVLETEIRALRAAIRPMAPELTVLLSAREAEAPTSDPPRAPGSEPASDAERQAVPPVATAPLDDASTTGYLPMLEELRGIARDASA
jgi:hypothetical protein